MNGDFANGGRGCGHGRAIPGMVPGSRIPACPREGGVAMRRRAAWAFGSLVGLLLAAWLAVVPPVQAQPPRPTRPRTPNDTLKSPEVAPDHKVTFRIYAPKASEVTIGGDWIAAFPPAPIKLKKDDQGV